MLSGPGRFSAEERDGESMPRSGCTVIGILGGVGAGKTSVAEFFGALGARVISADAIVHRLLACAPVRTRLAAALGRPLPEDDDAMRRTLAAEIFACDDLRRRVESVIHPLVEEEIRNGIDAGGARVAVLDVPLLVEAGMTHYCDVLVFVDTPAAVRHARAAAARRWGPEEAPTRERAQLDPARKRAVCDHVVDNSRDLAHTRAQVAGLWRRIHTDPN